MYWIHDSTGRFGKQPYYDAREFDLDCERTISEFLIERHGDLVLPIPTDTLTKLLERDASDLDLYADLGDGDDADIEGVTDFVIGEKPRVRIRASLSSDPRRENRLRTTLTHEYGHVKYHDPLYQLKACNLRLFDEEPPAPLRCQRDTMVNAPEVDWMEWQAGYICGALLMPLSRIREIARSFYIEQQLVTTLDAGDSRSAGLIETARSAFGVSADAARVRLQKLGLLSGDKSLDTLFQ